MEEEKKYLDYQGLQTYHENLLAVLENSELATAEALDDLDDRLKVIEDKNPYSGSEIDLLLTPITDKLENIEEFAEVNVQSDWNQTDTNADDYIKNKPTSMPASDVYNWAKAASKPSYTKSEVGLGNVTNDAQVKRSEMGAASGVATLDEAGKVPTSQLPSYVDDVLEYDTKSAFPTTGEAGKIYVDKSTNTSWRWSGTTYVQIKGDLVIGTTTGTAADGGVASSHYSNTSNPHSVTKTQVGLGSVVNTGDSATPVSGGTTKFTTGGAYTELNKKVDKVNGKGLSTNDYTTDEKNKLSGIASGAEVNQNAFSNVGVKVGNTTTTIAADAKTDTVTLIQGSNVTLTADTTNDTVTIAAKDTTYSAATTTAAGLMSADDKTKLNGIAEGAEVNVQSDWNATEGDAFIKNKPTIPSEVTESTVSGWGFTKNTGTVTGIKMNGASKGTSGVVDLGTVITAHQDISGKADKSATVSSVAYNTTSKKITKTINGTTSDVVTAAKIVTDGGGITSHQDISGKADKATTLAGYGITDAKIANGVITLGSNSITPLTSFTESDPVFTASAASGITSSDISNWNSKTSNTGTVTSVTVKMNGTTKGTVTTSGTIDLGTVLTSHQDISGKVDNNITVNGHALSSNVTISKSDIDLDNVTNDAQVKRIEMGTANGVATLNDSGKVPSSQLPSYVDDVIEGYYNETNSKFYSDSSYTSEITPEGGKIYIDVSTEKTYRWSGSAYAVIKGDIVIGTTTGTAADGKVVNDHITDTDIHITATERALWDAKYTKPSGGIPDSDLATSYLPLAGGIMTGGITMTTSTSGFNNKGILFGTDGSAGRIGASNTNKLGIYSANTIYIRPNSLTGASDDGVVISSDTITYNDNTMWHAGNDGAGSGLDADLLDGLHANAFYHLTGGTDLNASSTNLVNIDTLNTIGDYYCSANANVQYISTLPSQIAHAFRLRVGSFWNSTRYVYLRIQQYSDTAVYERYSLASTLNYSDWYQVQGNFGKVSTLESYFSSGSAKTAVALKDSVSLWGNDFNGTSDISGPIILPNNTAVRGKTTDGTEKELLTTTTADNLRIGYGFRSTTDSATYIYAGTGGMHLRTSGSTTRAFIDSSGNMGIGTTDLGSYKLQVNGIVGATNFYVTSDRSKKENIEQFSEHISKFTLKENNKDAYGVIAQDVPEMFREGEEGNYTVNYASILSYYVGTLENKVLKLEDELKELKKEMNNG